MFADTNPRTAQTQREIRQGTISKAWKVRERYQEKTRRKEPDFANMAGYVISIERGDDVWS